MTNPRNQRHFEILEGGRNSFTGGQTTQTIASGWLGFAQEQVVGPHRAPCMEPICWLWVFLEASVLGTAQTNQCIQVRRDSGPPHPTEGFIDRQPKNIPGVSDDTTRMHVDTQGQENVPDSTKDARPQKPEILPVTNPSPRPHQNPLKDARFPTRKRTRHTPFRIHSHLFFVVTHLVGPNGRTRQIRTQCPDEQSGLMAQGWDFQLQLVRTAIPPCLEVVVQCSAQVRRRDLCAGASGAGHADCGERL